MATPNLNITEVAAAQNQKHVTINNALVALDNAMNSATGKVIAGNTTLTNSEFRGALLFPLTGTPGVAFEFNVPGGVNRLFAVRNATGFAATVQVDGGGGESVELADGDSFILYSDGTDILALGGGGSASPGGAYDIRFGFQATPTTEQVLDTIPIVRDVTFPANFAGSVGSVGTNPTSSFEVSTQDDSVEIGTITIGTDGSFTFATAGGTPKTVSAGSLLTFVAPTSADATVANAVATLLGDI
jgi:hypothetical protein